MTYRPYLLLLRGLLAVTALCLGGCDPGPPENVVLVLIDTLRADHVGHLGYERDTTPFLDELASQGVVFENAISSAPATFPAVNTLMTARDAGFFFRASSVDLGIPEELTTLAEVFRESGAQTAAVSASPIVRRSPSALNPGAGFGQGFEHFDERCSSAGGRIRPHSVGCVTERALERVEALDPAPFFLYVHYLDPHDLYLPPRDEGGWVRPYDGKDFVANGNVWPIKRWLEGAAPDPRIDAADLRHLVDLYDSEIRSVDEGIRELLAGVERAGRLEGTLFVFVSDHGESFMEHGFIEHGNSLFETELHVPLLFYRPDRMGRGARRVSDPACLVDVMPTILDRVGLPVPDGARGVPLLNDDAPTERVCLSEHRFDWRDPRPRLVSVRSGPHKLIHDRVADVYGFYDLARDPGETRNLAGSRPPPFDDLLAALRARWQTRGEAEAPPVELDPEAERALRSLGYVE